MASPIGFARRPFLSRLNLQRPWASSRLRGRIEVVLDWAKVREYRTGENPARWRRHLNKLLPSRAEIQRVKHHAALPYAEMGEFMAELRRQQGLVARAMELMILTAARRGERIPPSFIQQTKDLTWLSYSTLTPR